MNVEKIIISIFVLNLFCILAFLQTATAQTDDVRPIEFAAGKTSAVVQAQMKRKDGIHDYKVRARAGQMMSVNLISKNQKAYFSIICPGCLQIGDTPFGMKDAYKIRRWTSAIPDSGDYIIRVAADTHAFYKYTLRVSVREQNLERDNPQLIRRISGTYFSKNNSLDVRLLPNGDVKFHLIALWKSPTNAEVIHDGEISARVPLKNNLAIYEKGKCKIVLEFSPNKITVAQTGSDSDCDFGANVTAAGTYRETR
ncbi:MAG: hypothetical protein ACR2HG_10155 [Pyrinomonadaceae bacterium]